MTLEMLTHTMEEVRHALFFKRQAVRLHGDAFRTYTGENMLCASAIKKYFYDLDRGVVERLAR